MAQDEQQDQGRGFAGMDKEKQREIASKGGGASGGNPENLENVDRSEAGRKGGEASGGNAENIQRGGGNRGNASNLSQEDREKGGERSRSGGQ